MVKKTLTTLLFFIPTVLIFKNWFFYPFLSAHDFPYFFRETLFDFPLFPPPWSPTFGIGLGGEIINYGLGIYVYAVVSLFVNTIGLPWELVYKIFIFGLFIIASVFSISYLLSKVLNNPTKLQLLLSSLLFSANTYSLMIVDGGQMGVALAYSLSPLVLAVFIELINRISLGTNNIRYQASNIKYSIISALVLAIQIMFDLRMAILTTGAVIFYLVFHHLFIKKVNLILNALYFILIIIVNLGLHASWILPIILSRSNPAQEIINQQGSLSSFIFFSFATFPQTISLLHPNWYENIFGKVYFMRPEFVILPILAYSSLLFIKNSKLKVQDNLAMKQFSNEKIVIFFVLLGLLGAFLAKGANPPLSQLNTWLFIHMPFSGIFRDSTKFYMLTALSYSVLIPFTVHSFQMWLSMKLKIIIGSSKKYKKIEKFSNIAILSISIFCSMLLIRYVFLNQLSGTFKRHEIPQEYIKLKNFLYNQNNFSRTLWIPRQDRFNFFSYQHPAVSGEALFSATNSIGISKELKKKQAPELLSNLSIRYVIVPYDSFGEIFVSDKRYDEKQYKEIIKQLDSINWLKRLEGFGSIAVYEVAAAKDHFWIEGKGTLSYLSISTSLYKINISLDKPSNIIFTDNYSSYWVADKEGNKIKSKKTKYNMNSFYIDKKGEHPLTVYFSKQDDYILGRKITLLFVMLLLTLAFYDIMKKFHERKN